MHCAHTHCLCPPLLAGRAAPACLICSAFPKLLRANRSNRFDRYPSAAAASAVAVAASTQIGSACATATSSAAGASAAATGGWTRDGLLVGSIPVIAVCQLVGGAVRRVADDDFGTCLNREFESPLSLLVCYISVSIQERFRGIVWNSSLQLTRTTADWAKDGGGRIKGPNRISHGKGSNCDNQGGCNQPFLRNHCFHRAPCWASRKLLLGYKQQDLYIASDISLDRSIWLGCNSLESLAMDAADWLLGVRALICEPV